MEDLFLAGADQLARGNMSVRTGDRIYITGRGAMLGRLGRTDIVKLDICKDDQDIVRRASSEAPVHRAIYLETDARAIVHAHPPYATLLSMTEENLVPVDWEGSYFFKKIPVLNQRKKARAKASQPDQQKYEGSQGNSCTGARGLRPRRYARRHIC